MSDPLAFLISGIAVAAGYLFLENRMTAALDRLTLSTTNLIGTVNILASEVRDLAAKLANDPAVPDEDSAALNALADRMDSAITAAHDALGYQPPVVPVIPEEPAEPVTLPDEPPVTNEEEPITVDTGDNGPPPPPKRR